MALKRERARGRKESGRFVMLPHAVIQHRAVITLSPAARWVLVAVAAQFNGKNNGALALPLSTASSFGITSSNTLSRGLHELESRSLIVKTFQGSYSPPLPARYAITWQPFDDTTWSRKGAQTSTYRGWSDAA